MTKSFKKCKKGSLFKLEAQNGIDCVLIQAKNCANQHVVAELPDIPIPVMPSAMSPSDVTVNQFIEVELKPITLTQEFVNGAFDHIKSIATFNTTRAEYTSPSGLAQLERHTNTLAKMLKHRLIHFLKPRLPNNRSDLHPGAKSWNHKKVWTNNNRISEKKQGT
jgi:hypothetical protein